MGHCMKLTNDYWIERVSNPRKLHGQCNGVVMKQGNDGNQSKGGGGGGRGRNHFAKLLPFHPLFYLPHSHKVYSLPRFAIFLSIWQMALHKCTIHPIGSQWWNYFSLQFACSAAVLVDVGSSRSTIPVSEKPRAFVVGWGTALGGGRAI